MGYALSTYPDDTRGAPLGPDEEVRLTLEQVPQLSRMIGRSLVVPVTPALVREGAISRFASLDAVWLLATESLEDSATRRAVDRLIGTGFHFALQGFPEGDPLPPSLAGSTVVLDGARTSSSLLEARVKVLLEAGLRPLVRGAVSYTHLTLPTKRIV